MLLSCHQLMQATCPQVQCCSRNIYKAVIRLKVCIQLLSCCSVLVCQSEMDRKLFYYSLIQSTVFENITSKVHTFVICRFLNTQQNMYSYIHYLHIIYDSPLSLLVPLFKYLIIMTLTVYEFKSVHIKLHVVTLCEQGPQCNPYPSNG